MQAGAVQSASLATERTFDLRSPCNVSLRDYFGLQLAAQFLVCLDVTPQHATCSYILELLRCGATSGACKGVTEPCSPSVLLAQEDLRCRLSSAPSFSTSLPASRVSAARRCLSGQSLAYAACGSTHRLSDVACTHTQHHSRPCRTCPARVAPFVASAGLLQALLPDMRAAQGLKLEVEHPAP